MLEGQKSGRTLSRDRSSGRQHFFFQTLLPTRPLPFLPLFINLVNPCDPPQYSPEEQPSSTHPTRLASPKYLLPHPTQWLASVSTSTPPKWLLLSEASPTHQQARSSCGQTSQPARPRTSTPFQHACNNCGPTITGGHNDQGRLHHQAPQDTIYIRSLFQNQEM